jgi:hypothetical protein
MAGLSKYLALALFNATLNPLRVSLTPPPGLWLALHTAAPGDATYGHEATYASYARQPLNSLISDSGVENGQGEVLVTITNGSAVVFPASTDTSGQTITHWAIWDSAAAGDGNILYSGNLTSSRLIVVGDSVVVPEGNIVIEVV